MKRTGPLLLVSVGAGGAVVGFLLQLGLASAGAATLSPPVTVPITLVVVAAVVLAAAIPIYRAVRSRQRGPINPFQAMRVVVLAKASSLAGSLVVGIGLGLVAYSLSRPILPGVTALWLAIGTAIAGVVLLIAGLVAEQLCSLPPDDSEHKSRDGGPTGAH
jgi:hypothetical protein